MSTKINLEFPYSKDFKAGYLNINSEPRRVVALVGKDGSRTSTSYARYLKSCELKRYLKEDEHVDHEDDNKLNDVVSNLQILTQKENSAKTSKGRKMLTLICPICELEFTKEARNLTFKIQSGKTPTCSRICGYKKTAITLRARIGSDS